MRKGGIFLMLSLEAFNYIKYVFIFFVFIMVVLFIMISFVKKSKLINWFTVASISFICIVVSVLNLILLGYAADELNLRVIEYTSMFIAILVLSVINLFISYRTKK